jgi:hypothetical protein
VLLEEVAEPDIRNGSILIEAIAAGVLVQDCTDFKQGRPVMTGKANNQKGKT